MAVIMMICVFLYVFDGFLYMLDINFICWSLFFPLKNRVYCHFQVTVLVNVLYTLPILSSLPYL